MKVLLVNGSPHKNGSTNRALQEVEKTLQAAGVETEIFWIGNEPSAAASAAAGAGKPARASLAASSRNLPRRRRRRTALSSEALSTMRRPQAI